MAYQSYYDPEYQRYLAETGGYYYPEASEYYQGEAPQPAPKKQANPAVAAGTQLGMAYAKQQLAGQAGGVAAGQAAGGAGSAGLAGAGAAGEAGASAGSAAAGQAAGGGTPYFDVGAPSYAGYIAAAADAYGGYKNLKRKNVSSEDKATRFQQDAGLAVADVYTGGLAGLAERYARGQWGGTMRKLDKLDQRTNPGTKILSKMMGGLSQGQVDRRNIRDAFKQGGIADEDGKISFSGGRTYNTEAGTKNEWEVDASDPNNQKAMSQVGALAAILTQRAPGDKFRDTTTGYLANAITKAGGDSTANARELYTKAGYKDAASVTSAIDQAVANKQLTAEDAAAAKAGLAGIFQPQQTSTSSSSSSRSREEEEKKKRRGLPPTWGAIVF